MSRNDMVMDEYDDLGKDLPGSQRQGEPVAWLYKGTIDGDHLRRSRMDHFFAPVGGDGSEYVKGIPLYTHVDPAEVARLRTELENSYTVAEHERLVAKGQETNVAYIASLRTQLADLKRRYDRLLRDMATIAGREVSRGCTVADYAAAAIADSLSASAEPSAPKCGPGNPCAYPVSCGCQSAPVEIDERAEFEAWGADQGYFNLKREHSGKYKFQTAWAAWEGWQARAALERKP